MIDTSLPRSILTVGVGLTLCAAALLEQIEGYVAPEWFTYLGIGVITEWVIEWAAYWRKEGKI